MHKRIAIALVVGLGLRAAPAHANFLPGPVKKALAPYTKALGKQSLRLGAKTSARLDRAEAGLRMDHPGLAAALARTRQMAKPLSPIRLAGFATKRVKTNPLLVPTYVAATVGFDAAKIAAAASLPPELGAPAYFIAGIPQTVLSLVTAEHATRSFGAAKGQSPTLRDTVKDLRSEYGSYNERQDRRLERVKRTLGEK